MPCRYYGDSSPTAGRTGPGGQSIVEFALVLPVLILLILAVLDFGRVAVDYNALTNAAREGARYASTAGAGGLGTPSCAWPTASAPYIVCPPDIITNTMTTAPQVPISDVTALTVTFSVQPVAAPDPADPNAAYDKQWAIVLTYRFHPITTMFLGGASIPITVNARYIKTLTATSG